MTLEKGDVAEDFELLGNDGSPVTLSSFKGSKNVVLCFYPKNHLFGCPSKKVFEMAESVISVFPQIESEDTVLFAISVDSVESQAKFVDEYNLEVKRQKNQIFFYQTHIYTLILLTPGESTRIAI